MMFVIDSFQSDFKSFLLILIHRYLSRSNYIFPGITILAFMRYCLRSRKLPRKFVLGYFLYYNKGHLFQLGNYLGLFLGLKSTINNLLKIDSNLNSGKTLNHFISQMKGNSTSFSKSDYYDFNFVPKSNQYFLSNSKKTIMTSSSTNIS
jgi:hypothetical protein